ncbi:hypothetical protein FSP39_010823 [Pinctada imbricata]|uniref:DUF4537 domain-containing protein n=1 Tax=Pinctada imbricata TaxID=66713 RepID=A0AA88YDN1_PINIB|nr:hypothetical protein FSP39_010823 [Pinctada imbricata]
MSVRVIEKPAMLVGCRRVRRGKASEDRKQPKSQEEVVKEISIMAESMLSARDRPSSNYLDRKAMKPKMLIGSDNINHHQAVIRKVLDTLKGQHVIARRDHDGLYYPGVVVRCPDPRHAMVEFAGKEQVLIPTRLVIATSGAVARPHLMMGDCVLVKVINSDVKMECYAPGIVKVTPASETAQAKFYTIVMYNGQEATTLRNHIMKISKSRFEFAIRYIAEIQMQEQERIDENVYVQTPRSTDRQSRKSRHHQRKVQKDRQSEPQEDDVSYLYQGSESRQETASEELFSPRPSGRPAAPTPNTARLPGSPAASDRGSRSRSRSKSPEQSRSRSRSRSSSHSRSRSSEKARKQDDTIVETKPRSRSRSRSRSGSRSRSRSKSRSRSRSKSRSRSRSRSKSRSRSRSKSGSRSRSKSSRSRSRSSSSDRSRSPSPIDIKHRSESMERLKKKSKKLKSLKRQLRDQQYEHEIQQQQLQKQAKKLKKLKKKLKKKKKFEKSFKKVGTHSIIEVESSSDSSEESKNKTENTDTTGSVTAPEVSPGLLRLRKSLPVLREGEEVLARWSDEGWYFRGVVKQDCDDNSYIIEDSTRMCERIWREDIITDYDDANQIIQPKDPVVALHPHYSFSYAPGVVLEVYHNMEMKVRFYDGEENRLPRDEIYKLTTEKFEHDVNYIIQCETRWVGQAVVSRDDRTGTYHLASVKSRVGNGREYLLEWCDGETSVQTSHHIFGVFTKHHPLSVGDHVLAMWDPQQHVYLPGWVAGIVGEKINIKFCDGSIHDVDDVLQCFWLSTDYYENAVLIYKKSLSADSA